MRLNRFDQQKSGRRHYDELEVTADAILNLMYPISPNVEGVAERILQSL